MIVLRKPEKAFSIIVADWDARIKAIAKTFEVADAGLELEVAKKFKSIVEDLGKSYAELQAHYQAAYLQFAANPCGKEANNTLAKANNEIRRREFKLREIEIKTEQVMRLIKTGMKKELKREYRGFRFGTDAISAIEDDIKDLVSEFRRPLV